MFRLAHTAPWIVVLLFVLERFLSGKEKLGMRILCTSLLAVGVLLFGATSASAFAMGMVPRGPINNLLPGDEVIVDVFLNAEPGLQLLSVGVLYPNNGTILYDGPATAALPPVTGSGNGAQPSYILYSPGSGMAASMVPATLLEPVVSPYFTNWAGDTPPFADQVNIDYAEIGFNSAPASGAGIYIATLLFRIQPGFFAGNIQLCMICGGNILRANDVEIGPAMIDLSPALILTGGTVPEPTTAMLIGFGVLGVAIVGRRRA